MSTIPMLFWVLSSQSFMRISPAGQDDVDVGAPTKAERVLYSYRVIAFEIYPIYLLCLSWYKTCAPATYKFWFDVQIISTQFFFFCFSLSVSYTSSYFTSCITLYYILIIHASSRNKHLYCLDLCRRIRKIKVRIIMYMYKFGW